MSSFKGCRPTISRSPKVPCGNRTRLAGLEDRRLRRSAKGTRSGRRESRTLKAHRSAVFRTAAVAHRLALPFSSCGGRNRTCNRLLNREPPYHSATPQKSREGGLRTHGLRFPKPADWPTFLPLDQSTQRELNPHVLHGEQAGCRYITGA